MNSANENYENFKLVEHLINLRMGIRSAYPKRENALIERKALKEEREDLLLKIDDGKVIQDAIEFHRKKYQEECVIFESN